MKKKLLTGALMATLLVGSTGAAFAAEDTAKTVAYNVMPAFSYSDTEKNLGKTLMASIKLTDSINQSEVTYYTVEEYAKLIDELKNERAAMIQNGMSEEEWAKMMEEMESNLALIKTGEKQVAKMMTIAIETVPAATIEAADQLDDQDNNLVKMVKLVDIKDAK